MSLTLAWRGAESRGSDASMHGMSLFLSQLADRYPAVRSIWAIGDRADGGVLDSESAFDWHLVAFADKPTLYGLRKATDLHRTDVVLRVVTDGDRFEVAWGRPDVSGSLFQWDWRQVTEKEAFYSEARWTVPVEAGNVERTRRRAVRVWQPARTAAPV
jgi:hypothetical protein